jgi:glutamate---cysteine ligase / carboxylate-amine ligase
VTHRFGESRPFSVGVEEELVLVDARTLDAAPLFEQVVPDPGPRLKPELFACLVETTTPICSDAAEAHERLVELRREVARRAQPHGARLLAAGTHPTARAFGQPILPERRYEKMVEELGDAVYRQLVCGLHVHVGMPSPEACVRTLEGVLPWLPLVVALSANSPFVEGRDTGLRSARIGRLAELPSGPPPPPLRSWADWEAATSGRDYTRLWWDVRPHPRLGTLEVRVADQQTDVRRSAGIAALVQALAAAVADGAGEPYDRELYRERREDAARVPPAPADVAALAGLVEAPARSFGAWPLVDELLRGRPEAERQLEVGLANAAGDIADRSLA